MHKCITDVIYYIICLYLYLFCYISYFILYIFNRFRIACAAADGWNYVMHIKWQLFAAKQLSFGGPNLKSRRQKARTHRQANTHTHTQAHRDTRQQQETVDSRNARCKCGIMPKNSVENVSPQSSTERGHLLCRKRVRGVS